MTLALLALLVACDASSSHRGDAVTPPETCLGDDLGSAVGTAVAAGSNEGMGDDHAGACDADGAAGASPHGEDIALTWTAPSDGRYGFGASTSTYETVVSLLEGHACSGDLLACGDEEGLRGTSFVTGSFQAGDAVTVLVDAAHEGEVGTWILDIVHDACTDQDLGSETGPEVASGSNAAQVTTLAGDCGLYAADVTFAWTAPHAGTWVFDTVGSRFDTVLAIADDCDGAVLACDDDAGETSADAAGTSRLEVEMEEGQAIVIGVAGAGGEYGEFVLNIEELPGVGAEGCEPPLYGGLMAVVSDQLVDVDPVTGAATPTGVSFGVSDLWEVGVDPVSGRWYGVRDNAGLPLLVTLDPCSGQVTTVGPLDDPLGPVALSEGFTFDGNGQAWAAWSDADDYTSQFFGTVDVATGQLADRVVIDNMANDADGLWLNADGSVWLSDTNSCASGVLCTSFGPIEASGRMTGVGYPALALSNFAADPATEAIYAYNYDQGSPDHLYSVDPTTGQAAVVGAFDPADALGSAADLIWAEDLCCPL